jgi:hypothetical protein
MFRALIFVVLFLIACNGSSQKLETPKEFVSNVVVDDSMYVRDKAAILDSLYWKMKRHEATFTNPEYYDSTELSVDTVMYDFSLNKIAVFVVTKNPIHRNLYSQSKLPFYYHANCYLGKRKYVGSNIFELKPLGPFSLINFDDKQKILKAISEYYFLELATVLDENNQPVFKYNLNDKRFWDSRTGWRRMFN